jgi:hypothetical protein
MVWKRATQKRLTTTLRVAFRHSPLLTMGDTGTGKSALIRRILLQIEERGETASVYNPALDYTPEFYRPERGDAILNPLDQRMPYWSPGEELRHPAEALPLATSLFPERRNENQFFVEGPRKIFAHLLTYRPTPEQMSWWMCHEGEIDQRVKGTQYAAMLDKQAPAQRSGILASLNMLADSLKLFPSEGKANGRWSAAEWSKKRKGWLFLTTTSLSQKQSLKNSCCLINSHVAALAMVLLYLDIVYTYYVYSAPLEVADKPAQEKQKKEPSRLRANPASNQLRVALSLAAQILAPGMCAQPVPLQRDRDELILRFWGICALSAIPKNRSASADCGCERVCAC